MDYLGPDRESIGREKAGIMRTGRPAIVSDPVPPQSVLDRAVTIGADLWPLGRDFNFSGDKQQWAWAGRGRRYAGLAYPALRGANQLINASGVLAALEALRQSAARSRRRRCATAWPWSNCRGASRSCPGSRRWCSTWRTTRIRSPRWRPISTRWASIRPRMRVFGAMADKDLAPMLAQDRPADRPLVLHRPADAARRDVRRSCSQNGRRRTSAPTWARAPTPDPMEALRAAVAAADPADRIVVFGSFYTVGGVLKDGMPRLQAKHLAS